MPGGRAELSGLKVSALKTRARKEGGAKVSKEAAEATAEVENKISSTRWCGGTMK